MAKHITKKSLNIKQTDSIIIIISVIGTVIIGDYVSACVMLVLHQIFMFVSHTMMKDVAVLPDSGNSLLRKIYNYSTYALLALAFIFAVFVPLKTHSWSNCGRIAVILGLISCQNRIFDSMDFSLYRSAYSIQNLGIDYSDYDTIVRLGKVKSLIFNKTGTITEDYYNLVGIYPKNISESQFVSIVTKLESQTEHPISESIGCESGVSSDILVEQYEGKGLVGDYSGNKIIVGNARLLFENQIKCDVPDQYGSAVHLAVNGEYCGYMVFENKTRAGTFDYIEQIRDSGIEYLYMLSCDLQSVVQPISQALGFNVFKAEMDTESKCSTTDYIVSNKPEGSMVAYAGNKDELTPGMHADVFIGIGDTSDADICINNDGISLLPQLFNYANRFIRINRINLYISIISRCFVACLLILGVKNSIPAVVILFLSSVFTFIDLDERIRL